MAVEGSTGRNVHHGINRRLSSRHRRTALTPALTLAVVAVLGTVSSFALRSPSSSAQDQYQHRLIVPGLAANPPATVPPDESQLAKSMLLTVSDFPSSWTETPFDSGEASPAFDQCPNLRDSPDITGSARTGDFSRGGLDEVSQSVVIFGSDAAAEGGASVIRSSAQCVVNRVNEGYLDEGDISFSDAQVGDLSFRGGQFDSTTAIRVSMKAAAASSGITLNAYFDLIYQRDGRTASFLVTWSLISPFNTALLEQLSAIAAARIAEASLHSLP